MTMRDHAAISLLAEMVRIDSTNPLMGGSSDGQAVLGALLENAARAMGLSTRRQNLTDGLFNLIIWHEADPALPWILFDSHLDTVSTSNMTIPPFDPAMRDGRIFGRGACDTKSSGAAMLTAIAQYARSGNQSCPSNVVLTFTCDEEVAKTGVNALVADDFAALPGGRPAAAIIGEPTKLSPVVAHGGVVRWSIVTHGKAAHSSNPSLGESAISMMAAVIRAIESDYAPSVTATHPLVGRSCCSINLIRGGSAINIIPDRCEIEIDRRLMPGEDASQVVPTVEMVLNQLRLKHPSLRVTQQAAFVDLPLSDSHSRNMVDVVCALLKARNLSDKVIGVPYGTNASQFANGGVPAIVLGPGDIAQAHTADEWVDVDQVCKAVDVYLAIMKSPLHQEVASC